MRILQVCHNFLPLTFAGVEIHVYYLAKILGNRHTVHVLYPVGDRSAKEYSISFGKYKEVQTIRLVNHLSHIPYHEMDVNPGVSKAFEEALDRIKPDIVHFHHMMGLSLDLPDAVKARNIACILTLHDYWMLCPKIQLFDPEWGRCKEPSVLGCTRCCFKKEGCWGRWFKRFPRIGDAAVKLNLKLKLVPTMHEYGVLNRRFKRTRSLLSKVDHIIANSFHLRKRFIKYGAPSKKMSVINYGVNTANIVKRKNPVRSPIRFGYLGSIIEHKGVHILLEAFRRSPQAQLEIWGDTEQYETVRSYMRKLNPPPNVKFMGKYEHHQISRVLNRMDALIIPSVWEEAYSITLDEAKFAGIPVIASNIGGMPEHLQHKKDGLLFRAGDVEQLTSWIQKLTENPKRIEELGSNGEDVLSLEENAQAMESIYHEHVKSGVRDPQENRAPQSLKIPIRRSHTAHDS